MSLDTALDLGQLATKLYGGPVRRIARRRWLTLAVFLLLSIGRFGWAPLVFPLWALMISVYIVFANFRPKHPHRAPSTFGNPGAGASVKPGIPDAKGNQFFCIRAGTKVVWMTSSKNTGFSISFGTDSPFTPDDPIIGGGSKPITVKAQNPGCYKYDAGAFYSGAVYGMSGGSKPELVILP
jgi:hypothetical protein